MEAGGKIINDFINDFPPVGEAGGKKKIPNPKFPKLTTVTTTGGL